MDEEGVNREGGRGGGEMADRWGRQSAPAHSPIRVYTTETHITQHHSISPQVTNQQITTMAQGKKQKAALLQTRQEPLSFCYVTPVHPWRAPVGTTSSCSASCTFPPQRTALTGRLSFPSFTQKSDLRTITVCSLIFSQPESLWSVLSEAFVCLFVLVCL